MPYIAVAAFREFGNPASVGVPRDEGEYLVPSFSTDNMLIFLGLHCDYQLLADIAGAFDNDDWTLSFEGSWMGVQPHQELSSLWQEFVQAIKHRTRFFFSEHAGLDGEESPHRILERIYPLIVKTGLIKRVDAGISLYRCRVRKPSDEWVVDMKAMGAPPESVATAGRMNPAGIAYLYAARERPTALAEVVGRPPFRIAVGEFKTTRALYVVDLSELPAMPSPFDPSKISEREALLFLQSFAEEISRPVGKDGAEHIDYVPSQVACEYFAQVVRQKSNDHEQIDGLSYVSAVMPGGRNLVLFPTDRGIANEFSQVEFVQGGDETIDTWPELMAQLARD
jgi:hypothetical protein